MRGAIFVVFVTAAAAACGHSTPSRAPAEARAGDRQLDALATHVERVPPSRPPTARGGGPAVPLAVPEARARISRAWCSLAESCDVNMTTSDECIARNEAALSTFAVQCEAIDSARLDACIEAIRARTCNDRSSPEQCSEVDLCKE